MKKSAVLWTGGKDSALALFISIKEGHQIDRLITFAPPNPTFLAHPLEIIKEQAIQLAIPHQLIEITPPYDENYEEVIAKLKKEGIDTLITGDIAKVNNEPNWIRERSKKSGMKVFTPLWDKNREDILIALIENGFNAIFSCINTTSLEPSWLGNKITLSSIKELQEISSKTKLDICGENGEYHTLVLNCPLFTTGINLPRWEVGIKDDLAHLKFSEY